MTIKQQGGVFGRNPTFNNVAADGVVSTNTISEKTAGSGVTVDGVLLLDGNAWVSGTNPTFRMVQTDTTDKNFSFRLNGDTLLFERRNDAFSVATQLLNVNTATGNIAFPSGQGIDFSATSGTGTSELFNDYEEGTFTPVVADAASGGNVAAGGQFNGQYTKIGRQVTIMIEASNIDTTGMTAVGDIYILGLPFVAASLPGTQRAVGSMWASLLTIDATTPNLAPNLDDNTNYIRIIEYGNGLGTDYVMVNQISSGTTDIFINLTYIAA